MIELLTPRESDVLRLMADGLTDREIAARLGIQWGRVRAHVAEVRGKLLCSTRTEAVVKAQRLGLVGVSRLSPVAMVIAQLLATQPDALGELIEMGVLDAKTYRICRATTVAHRLHHHDTD